MRMAKSKKNKNKSKLNLTVRAESENRHRAVGRRAIGVCFGYPPALSTHGDDASAFAEAQFASCSAKPLEEAY